MSIRHLKNRLIILSEELEDYEDAFSAKLEVIEDKLKVYRSDYELI